MSNGRFIDLNLETIQKHTSTTLWKELMDEFRQNNLRSTDGLCALRLRVSLLRRTVSWQLQGQEFFLLGSIFDLGFRPAHLSRESQRYRSVSASNASKALSHGHPHSGVAQHLGQRQSSPRLENLCRLCPYPYPRGTYSVQGRAV